MRVRVSTKNVAQCHNRSSAPVGFQRFVFPQGDDSTHGPTLPQRLL